MGMCKSKEEREAEDRNHQIDVDMKKEALAGRKTVKLLLLGAGESGKSTILKQMKILHDNGFSEEEYNQQRAVVYSNTLQSMAVLLRAMTTLRINFADTKLEAEGQLILDVIKAGDESEPFTRQVSEALKVLWEDKGIQLCYSRNNEFQLNDSAKYFFDELERISQPNFRPTEQDILRTRVKTTGIVEVTFQLKGLTFRVFDVGGQRSERKKWIHCFEDVNAIIFIVAMSEYDQVLFEDVTTNRIHESMRLFESICNSQWFVNSSMILFLNKKDLFAQKILQHPLTVAFPDYRGSQGFAETANFIQNQFEKLNKNEKKQIYCHQTCATDTNQVQFVLDSSIDMIIAQNLKGCGLY